MVIFVSECEKRALKRTRRVLDAFANRIGTNTWQTLITQEGLRTVKKMLRKTASKSTAVSCHWIRSKAHSEFLWVVGNKNKFNTEGFVAVNTTEQDLILEEKFALNAEVIANLSSLAGFFHDIGKANYLFQQKLDVKNTGRSYEPLRHEWVSLRIFQAFVGSKDDQQWLKALVDINNTAERVILEQIIPYQDLIADSDSDWLLTLALPPIAKAVAWLIVSHHRLPQYFGNPDSQPSLANIEQWRKMVDPCWNASQSTPSKWESDIIQKNWTFPYGTPFKSAFWQTYVSKSAKRALYCQRLVSTEYWQQNLFTLHVSRLALMLADHSVSSQAPKDNKLTDRNYLAYANTDKDTQGRRFKNQKLDEHNILVGELAYKIAFDIPQLRHQLKHLGVIKALEKKVPKQDREEFGWQDKAAELALKMRDKARDSGFFGISMASTGKGKTRANAKIMYALSEKGRCRFNVALGLRTLSIQTANALKEDLELSDEDVALLIGSQAVRDLQQVLSAQDKSIDEDHGSQSKESLLKDEIDLHDNVVLDNLKEIEWVKHDPKISRLLHAPVLVSTIDYLIPATEGVRGGRQIAPMLRLLTSDLVLDEPDDFSIDDLPALCRLVNWAGLLGAKVLLSTATISPSLASALFEAYQAGRIQYTQANGEKGLQLAVCCAWFDECNKPQEAMVQALEQFEKAHKDFVKARVDTLAKTTKKLRKGQLVTINQAAHKKPSEAMAERVIQSITALHHLHAVPLNNKYVSIGLVRMANIDPLVQTAKHLFATSAPENTKIYYCVYHGQFPLIQRSMIEKQLDKALKRHDSSEWAAQSGIPQRIEKDETQHHIFVVLATSVAEVGRDHDYDWAIVEPSSMRSVIQLAGRVQRHRKITPLHANIHVLSKNFKGVKGKQPTFEKPGFETEKLQYYSNDLKDLLVESEIEDITAIPRVILPTQYHLTKTMPKRFEKFSQLEHFAQMLRLKGNANNQNHAAQWWQKDVTWCAEMQRIQPFRQSRPTQDYCLALSRDEKLIWKKKEQGRYPINYSNTNDIEMNANKIRYGDGVSCWYSSNLSYEINQLLQHISGSEKSAFQVYTHVSLDSLNNNTAETWHYDAQLGIYKNLK